MKIIAGLGNPDEKYSITRHNAGFMVLDALALELGLAWEKNKKFKALIIKIPGKSIPTIKEDTVLVKPQDYMNNSGGTMQAVLKFYNIDTADENLPDILTVIHDDLDIDLGKYKISVDSRAAGHNGVQSIIDRIGTKNFTRIRIGIKPMPQMDLARRNEVEAAKFVLEKFKLEELETIKNLLPEIIKKIR
jgi:peptidyl-tRNA hydrolase, PTH1 family